MRGAFGLRGLENGKHAIGTAGVKQAAAAGGDGLVVGGAEVEEVAEFVVASTETLCRGEALEPAHASCSTFHAAVVLLQPIVLVGAGPVHDVATKRRTDRPRAGAVPVGGDLVG